VPPRRGKEGNNSVAQGKARIDEVQVGAHRQKKPEGKALPNTYSSGRRRRRRTFESLQKKKTITVTIKLNPPTFKRKGRGSHITHHYSPNKVKLSLPPSSSVFSFFLSLRINILTTFH